MISLPLSSQLKTSSRKISVKYVGPVVVYKIIDPNSFLLCTWDGKLLICLFKHERLKSAIIRISKGNVTTLAQLEQVSHAGIKLS